ncbi:MAG: sulfite exporter TauE/SafE family protein [Candidatus Omnitrophica bacterium]|nr:sulfite exporter TauE/SafE family protein [Candidatus Omnitrophota bacterium]
MHNAWIFFASGIILNWGPCVGQCAPFFIPYVVSTKTSVQEGIKAWISFWAGKLVAYLLLGLLVGLLGERALSYNQGLRHLFWLGGIFIALLGILIFLGKENRMPFCSFLHRNIVKKDRGIFATGFFISVLPCLPLLGIFSYLVLIIKHWWQGIFYILCFGLGSFFSPLLILAIFSAIFPKIFLNRQRIYLIFQRICGIFIFGLGVKILLGK